MQEESSFPAETCPPRKFLWFTQIGQFCRGELRNVEIHSFWRSIGHSHSHPDSLSTLFITTRNMMSPTPIESLWSKVCRSRHHSPGESPLMVSFFVRWVMDTWFDWCVCFSLLFSQFSKILRNRNGMPVPSCPKRKKSSMKPRENVDEKCNIIRETNHRWKSMFRTKHRWSSTGSKIHPNSSM